jgi:hypothetical protein
MVRLTDTVHVTTVRKLLLAVLLVSLAGSAFGAGTFATFNASTTNGGATFASGSLVLSNNQGANTCFSNGTTANGAGASTDANTNSACAAAFTLDLKKPGDVSTATLTMTNVGSLAAAAGLQVFGTAICTPGNRVGETYLGTGNMCEQVMFSALDSSSTVCKYGGGSSTTLLGTAISGLSTGGTVVIGTANDQFTLTINGTGYPVTIPNATYGMSTGTTAATGLATTLAGALQAGLTAASAPAIAGVGPDGIVYIAPTAIGNQTVSIANTGADTTLTTLSMTSTSSTPGGQTACTYDPAHSLMNFTKAFTSTTGLNLVTPFNASATKTYVLGLKLDTNATNNIQGKQAGFSLTWLES